MQSLDLLIVSVFVGAALLSRRDEWSRGFQATAVFILLILIITASLVWEELSLFQHALVSLLAPAGLVWLVLLTASFRAWQIDSRLRFRWFAVCFGLYTVVGNAETASIITRWLEAPYRHINSTETEHVDAVLVLGGGVGTKPQGYVQLWTAGDRAALAARLFHLNKTDTLVTVGDVRSVHLEKNWRQNPTRVLWKQMGIPDASIRIAAGVNTKGEIASAAELIRVQDWQRVGLITSAWHMRRALCHARRHKLNLVALPADFQSGPFDVRQLRLIPDGAAMMAMHRDLRELIAMAVGR